MARGCPTSQALYLLIAAAVCALMLAARCSAEVTSFIGPHGVRVVVAPDAESSFVAICVMVRAGIAEEGNAPGVGSVTAQALFGRNLNLSAEEVQRIIYDVGGSLQTTWTPDYTRILCVTSPAGFEDAFYLVCQALKNAEFDAPTVQRALQVVRTAVERQSRDPFEAAYAAAREATYPDSVYRQPFGGTVAGLRRVTTEAIRTYFRRWYTPGRTTVAVAGNITPERVRQAVEDQLVDYDRPDVPQTPRHPASAPSQQVAPIVRSVQAHTALVLACCPAPGVTDADYPAAAVLTAILGGGKSSRIFRSVRDTAAIGYAVGASIPPLERHSFILAFVEFDPKREDIRGTPLSPAEVQKRIRDTVASLLDRPPTQDELERAKRYLTGTYALKHERLSDRAFYLAWYELLGLGWHFDTDYPYRIQAVTLEDVERVARKYLQNPIFATAVPVGTRLDAGAGASP
ncbi:MAG: M16 family metallopeptidase [Chthonomonadales bacterium]